MEDELAPFHKKLSDIASDVQAKGKLNLYLPKNALSNTHTYFDAFGRTTLAGSVVSGCILMLTRLPSFSNWSKDNCLKSGLKDPGG